MNLAAVDLVFCGTFLMTITAGSFGMVINNGGEQVDNNILNSSPPARISGFRAKDWIKISQAPPQVINTQLGARVELECEVLGSPAPEIQWFRGNQMVQQTDRNSHNNELSDSYHDKAGLAKIKSRLVIDCVSEKHEGFYTCVAHAGAKKMKSQPSLLLIEGGNGDGCKAPEEERLQPPRIVSWNPTAMENMGVDVLLPCTAVGNPTPDVYWLDQDNNVVSNFRYRVLNNGDLAIYRLAWPDMGQYKCVAENSLGRDSVNTFIYPVMMVAVSTPLFLVGVGVAPRPPDGVVIRTKFVHSGGGSSSFGHSSNKDSQCQGVWLDVQFLRKWLFIPPKYPMTRTTSFT